MISVIVPVYNAEKYLRKCLDSICNQTYKDLEIILVDDGSKDGSSSICDEYEKKDSRVKVIHKQNGGSTSARNAGLAIASGEYIGFVDSDDWIESEMYEVLVDACVNHDAEIVICNRYTENGNSISCDKLCLKEGLYTKYDSENAIIKNMFYTEDFKYRGVTATLWDKLFKRELIIKHQAKVDERTKYSEDEICVCSALLDAERIYVVDRALYHYCINSGSIIHSPDELFFEKITLFYAQMKRILAEQENSELLLEKLKRYMLEYVLRGVNLLFGFRDYAIIPFFIPPYKLLKEKQVLSVVLYGAGRVGQDYYKSLQMNGYIDVVAWVDRQYENYREKGLPVDNVDELAVIECDGILIAVENEDLAERIKKSLIELGVNKELLLWERPRTMLEMLDEDGKRK